MMLMLMLTQHDAHNDDAERGDEDGVSVITG